MQENRKIKAQLNKMKTEVSSDFIDPFELDATSKLAVRSYAGPKEYRKALMEKSRELSRKNKEE
ncbi:hypothetical protein [Sporosarcina sp. FA9]|uniref:hypothetical protein n=1 Tax=Sporosarcina sp. FA9 TaxID=3413030 RepID=UPI003F65B672